MNLHVNQSTQAQTECRKILHIRNNAVNGGMNCAVFSAVQDTMCGLNLMTRPDAMVSVELLMDCAMHQRYNWRELHEILDDQPSSTEKSTEKSTNKSMMKRLVPAWWALDMLFPRDFCYSCDGVVIVDGRIQPGSAPFTSKHAGKGSSSINYVLAIDYDNATSVEWLSDAGRTAYVYMTQWHGFSVSLSDMHISEAVAREAQQRIQNACEAAERRDTDREQLESLSAAMQAASAALDQTSFANPDNALHTMIVSGAKGSRLNAQQLMVAVGQQVIGSDRPPLDGNGRTLSCFRPGGLDSRNAQSRGMISQSYCHALGPVENFFHSAAARKGLAETVRHIFCFLTFLLDNFLVLQILVLQILM
jgi:DNA-directed RNA polymerase beta' subunit